MQALRIDPEFFLGSRGFVSAVCRCSGFGCLLQNRLRKAEGNMLRPGSVHVIPGGRPAASWDLAPQGL